jgi:hypothetical protein
MLDERDTMIATEIQAAYFTRLGPQVGDFVQCTDGLLRICFDHGDHVQTTPQLSGSYHATRQGLSYSGGLRGGPPKARLQRTLETRTGRAWFFHHGHRAAHNGVEFGLTCRVWRFDGGCEECMQ